MKTDNRNIFAIKSFLREYLDLRKDKDNELETIDSIRKGVEFKGANLWILIFAIFMASLGLNVNSTAVIIGAMLISPLMGPIMGVGLSVGMNDFELMKRSLKSFLITTAFSVTTATVYFLFTPIAEAQSELLARTSPTIYDVFIALFGGLAGVVALYQGERKCDTGCCHRHCIDAATLYGRIRIGIRQSDLLSRCFLSLFHKFCLYQSGYLSRCAGNAFSAKRICR